MPEYPKSGFKVEGELTLNNIPTREKQSAFNKKKYVQEYYNTQWEVNHKFKDEVKKHNPEDYEARVGVLAEKVGMTHVWDKWGKCRGLTVLQVELCQVTSIRTPEKGGFYALQVGFGEKSIKRVTKPEIGH